MRGNHLLFAALVMIWTACEWKEHNPYFCPPGRTCDQPAPPCQEDNDCDAPLLCDPDALVCVQCTSARNEACVGTTPACGDDGRCRACEAHSECSASEACLPDGTCADPAQVAYVKPTALGGTDNTECTLTQPCTKSSEALATGRPYVKLSGTNDEGATVSITNRNVTVLAESDAKLVRMTNGDIVKVEGSSQVKIFDLEISGASGGASSGIAVPNGYTGTLTLTRVKLLKNAGSGIILGDGGTLNVSQSTITSNAGDGISAKNGTLDIAQSTISGSGNSTIPATGIAVLGGKLTLNRSMVSGNSGGALRVESGGVFVVVGNVFVGNGLQAGVAGGISITTTQNAMNRLEFNSFTLNQAQVGIGNAIQCTAGSFTARNNIMSGNGTLSNLEQVGGPCQHAYSIARPGMKPAGATNSDGDPLFKDAANGDLHLMAGSPALKAADPASELTGPVMLDIDGDQRESPADMGADQVPR